MTVSEGLRRFAETRLPAGYATAIETMVERMEKLGVRVLLGAALVDIKPGRENSTLSFQGSTLLVNCCLRACERTGEKSPLRAKAKWLAILQLPTAIFVHWLVLFHMLSSQV